MNCLAFALVYLATLAVALAMKSHHTAVFRRPPGVARQRAFRLAAIAAGSGALGGACACAGWEVGVVTWIAMLAVSGFLLSQLLAFAPRWVHAPGVALLLAAGALALN